MLSSFLVVGRGIRTNCGASCPFGSLDRGDCGLVVGDAAALLPQGGGDPVGKTASTRPSRLVEILSHLYGLDHGVGHFRPLSITLQRHLLVYHGMAMHSEDLRQVF